MPPPADLSPEAHAKLDGKIRSKLSGLSLETHAAVILLTVLADSVKAYHCWGWSLYSKKTGLEYM